MLTGRIIYVTEKREGKQSEEGITDRGIVKSDDLERVGEAASPMASTSIQSPLCTLH